VAIIAKLNKKTKLLQKADLGGFNWQWPTHLRINLTIVTAANTFHKSTDSSKKNQDTGHNQDNQDPSLQLEAAFVIDGSTAFKIIENSRIIADLSNTNLRSSLVAEINVSCRSSIEISSQKK